MFVWLCILGALVTYLLGSIPLSRWFRAVVSKLLPMFGAKTASFASVIADIVKGFLATTVFSLIVGQEFTQFGILFAYLGHIFPVCPRCIGGNGLGLLLGALIALDPFIALVALLAWVLTYYVFRYATLSAVVAAAVTPVFYSVFDFDGSFHVLFVVAAIILLRLRINLRLLLSGKERMVIWEFNDV